MTCVAQMVSDQCVNVVVTVHSLANPLVICGENGHWARLLSEY
jgi:hypothetical protein